MEDSIDAVQRSIDAPSIAQVTGDGFVRSQFADPISLGRIVYERPDLQTL